MSSFLLAVACGDKAANEPLGTAGLVATAGVNAAGTGAAGIVAAGTGAAGTAQAGTVAMPAADGGMQDIDAGNANPGTDASVDLTGDGPSGTDTADGKLIAWIAKRAVNADQEDHICVTVALPNEGPLWVTAIHARLSTGSHHLIVDRAAAAGPAEPSSCAPTMGGDNTRLLIAQQPDTILNLPKDTAFRIAAHQAIFLQLHYINYTGKVADIEGSIELTTLPDSTQPAPTEVQSIFTGNMALFLPAGQETTAESSYTPNGTAGNPVHVFALTSHTHSLGIESTIERVPQGGGAATMLHKSVDWSEPPLTTFDPTLEFTGGDSLRLRCKYNNTTDHIVTFGTNFEDEMCFMWMYYYQK